MMKLLRNIAESVFVIAVSCLIYTTAQASTPPPEIKTAEKVPDPLQHVRDQNKRKSPTSLKEKNKEKPSAKRPRFDAQSDNSTNSESDQKYENPHSSYNTVSSTDSMIGPEPVTFAYAMTKKGNDLATIIVMLTEYIDSGTKKKMHRLLKTPRMLGHVVQAGPPDDHMPGVSKDTDSPDGLFSWMHKKKKVKETLLGAATAPVAPSISPEILTQRAEERHALPTNTESFNQQIATKKAEIGLTESTQSEEEPPEVLSEFQKDLFAKVKAFRARLEEKHAEEATDTPLQIYTQKQWDKEKTGVKTALNFATKSAFDFTDAPGETEVEQIMTSQYSLVELARIYAFTFLEESFNQLFIPDSITTEEH